MTDECMRANAQDQHAIRQRSKPTPISQGSVKWADIEYTDDEDDPLAGYVCQVARCETGAVAGGSLLRGADSVAYASLPR